MATISNMYSSKNVPANPELQMLGPIEAPIIRAALHEVDYSVSDTYARVIQMPVRQVAGKAIAATVQQQSVAPSGNESNVEAIAREAVANVYNNKEQPWIENVQKAA